MRVTSILLGASILTLGALARPSISNAAVKPGDYITKDNAAQVQELVSPGNYYLVEHGMTMKIISSDKLDWPPPFKAATEKYSSQVALAPDGTLLHFTAGQPFPLLDPNDPQI